MSSSAENQVRQISAQLVSEIAPEETMLFPATSEAYFKNPEATLREAQQTPGDDMVGFGIETAVVLLTPIILEVTKTALRLAARLGQQAVEDAVSERLEEKASGFIDKIANFFKTLFGEPAPKPVPKLTEAQLQMVRQAALSRAQELGLDSGKSALLADALVGKLTLTDA